MRFLRPMRILCPIYKGFLKIMATDIDEAAKPLYYSAALARLWRDFGCCGCSEPSQRI